MSVSGLRKIRFNAYTLRRIATKYQFPKKPGFLLSAFIILDWSHVDLLFKTERGKIRIMSNKVYLAISKCATITCRDRRKLRKLEYVSTLESILMKVVSLDFPNKSGVRMFICSLIYCVISVSSLHKIRFNGYTLHRILTKNQFTKKPGFPLSAYIILAWGNNNGENGRNLRSWRLANTSTHLLILRVKSLLRIPTNSSFYINCSS